MFKRMFQHFLRGPAMTEAVLGIKKWGNNFGVRLPSSVVRAVGLQKDQLVSERVEGQQVTIFPLPENEPSLEQAGFRHNANMSGILLTRSFTRSHHHKEVLTGHKNETWRVSFFRMAPWRTQTYKEATTMMIDPFGNVFDDRMRPTSMSVDPLGGINDMGRPTGLSIDRSGNINDPLMRPTGLRLDSAGSVTDMLGRPALFPMPRFPL
jgi:antitoxin component of MazEF toxin-antitoxin module